MKILAISDTHMMHQSIVVPECDVLIHSGDACNHGNMEEFSDFADWFSCQTQAKHRIYVPGNHDKIVASNPSLCRSMLDGCSVLVSESVVVEGVKFSGTPWTPHIWGAFQALDAKQESYPGLSYRSMEFYLDYLPGDTDVLICHGPPWAILDQNDHGESCGSLSLLNHLASGKIRPKCVVFGHIHESFGYSRLDDVSYYNVSSSLVRGVRTTPTAITLD